MAKLPIIEPFLFILSVSVLLINIVNIVLKYLYISQTGFLDTFRSKGK